MITYNCPKCGRAVPLKESCPKCSVSEGYSSPQHKFSPMFFFVTVCIAIILAIVIFSLISGRNKSFDDNNISILLDTQIDDTPAYTAPRVINEQSNVITKEMEDDPYLKLGYDDGYKHGYHRGYYDGRDQDEYYPYLPKGPNVRTFTSEYRSGYFAGYSDGYDEGETEFKEALTKAYEYIENDEYYIYDEYDYDYDDY